MIIVCLYIDDLIYSGNDGVKLVDFNKSMMKELDVIFEDDALFSWHRNNSISCLCLYFTKEMS